MVKVKPAGTKMGRKSRMFNVWCSGRGRGLGYGVCLCDRFIEAVANL
jgi:hypothetical protein